MLVTGDIGAGGALSLADPEENTMERKLRVLIVDDEPFIMAAASRVLESGGIDVDTCGDWTSVARAVRTGDPDLVLLDYNMPGIMGDEMCRILKRNAHRDDLRIVIFSSEARADLGEIVRDCGADGFIPKNAPGMELIARVRILAGAASRAV